MVWTLAAFLGQLVSDQFRSSSASWLEFSDEDSSITGSLITYFSLAQAPRSRSLQRSLQKGKSAFAPESVGLRQIGQWYFISVRGLD